MIKLAFGIDRSELKHWKAKVKNGEIAFLTHYWLDDRFPDCRSVTKVGCSDVGKLIKWGKTHELQEEWIHNHKRFPHFDLFGSKQKEILQKEHMWEHIERFNL